jgi:acetyl esterase
MTTSSRFDPGLEEFIRRSEAAPSDPKAPLAAQRTNYTAFARTFDLPRPQGLTSEDIELQGPAGPIPARLYRPRAGKLPVVAYFHGGGFLFGNPDSHDSFTADLAAAADAAVVSVDYRLAPEHPFPAAFDDCHAATLSVVDRADQWELDASRLVLAGDSSGGNLAAAVAIALRGSGGPPVRGQVLIYPMLGLDFATESCMQNPEAPMLKLATARALAGFYLPGGFDKADWRAAPLLAQDLSRLPPAFISVAEHDPLRDHGIHYAARLAQAGVPSVLSRAPGLVHSWIRARGASTAAAREYRRIVAELRAMLD